MKKSESGRRMALAALCAAVSTAHAAVLQVDASAPAAEPKTGYIKTGASASPRGDRIGINNQYLTKNGQPWLPVAGEFHYSRSPAATWEAELRKMKSAGVDVVTSYVIWNHHEEVEGKFDWRGDHDLRRFVQLAARAGLAVVVRVGPWAHAEVRYGGVPDWVVNAMPTRRDDPQYLRHVERLYREIGAQLTGQMWKDGGPVIAIQLENEYNLGGEGQGASHIMKLKGLALKAGFDVPLYTVTGWDHTLYPSGEVTPVFGGYPDEPWGVSTRPLPPKETYAFRFDTRVSGDLGAQTRASQTGTAETDMADTPFLGAEYGAGLPAMYRRRTLVSPDDIASMLPVQLGSGLNMVGYYMFHGGRNPLGLGGTTMEESTLSGGYNDTPAITYDFNAPLGPDGQQRPVLERLRPFHYFLRDFGSRLAPMTVRKPELVPASLTDLVTPRWSLRSKGDQAFVFFSNHVRQYPMAAQHGLQFEVKLPHGALRFPSQPFDAADGTYFIWPVNFDLDGTRLDYASAQPVARLDAGKDGIVYVFAASAGIPVEMALESGAAAYLDAPGAHVRAGERVVIDQIKPGSSAAFTLRKPQGRAVTVLVLSPEQAGRLAIGDFAGQRRLVLSAQQPYFADGKLELRSAGQPDFRLAVFPALGATPASSSPLKASGRDGLFQAYEAAVTPVNIDAAVSPVRPALPMPAPMVGGLAKAALQPIPESFRNAAAWDVRLSGGKLDGLDAALLDIDFTGDIGRLFQGTRMLDDWYYNGQRWQYDLKRNGLAPGATLQLSVLPLRADAPIYLPEQAVPDFGGQQQVASLNKVRVISVYKLTVGK
jgi:hypothetical protein